MDVYDWVTAIIAVIAWIAGFIRVQLCRRADSAAHPGLRVGIKAVLWVQRSATGLAELRSATDNSQLSERCWRLTDSPNFVQVEGSLCTGEQPFTRSAFSIGVHFHLHRVIALEIISHKSN